VCKIELVDRGAGIWNGLTNFVSDDEVTSLLKATRIHLTSINPDVWFPARACSCFYAIRSCICKFPNWDLIGNSRLYDSDYDNFIPLGMHCLRIHRVPRHPSTSQVAPSNEIYQSSLHTISPRLMEIGFEVQLDASRNLTLHRPLIMGRGCGEDLGPLKPCSATLFLTIYISSLLSPPSTVITFSNGFLQRMDWS